MVPTRAPARAADPQSPATPTAVKPMPRDADPDWEIATVRPSDPADARGQHFDFEGQRVAMMDTTVEQYLLLGYGVQKSQLAGLPAWTRTERWDIHGVPEVAGQPDWKQMQGLIRKILAERFGLQLHHEQREMPIFALRIAHGGAKMTPDTSDPDGWLIQRNRESNGVHAEDLKNASLADVTEILQFHVSRPIVDQTHLQGRYDLKVQWTVDDATSAATDAPPGLFTALEEQVGLKLEPVRAPADTLVIDRVQRPGAD